MAIKFTAAQVDQFRRDAKRLKHTLIVSLHEAQEKIAAQHGFANWSLLTKHSENRAKQRKPTSSRTAPSPGTTRHYAHGDQAEANPSLYFCARCDAFVEANHWSEGAPRWHNDGKDGKKFLASLNDWMKRPAEQARNWYRPADAPNVLAAPAFAERDAYEAARSPFHLWLGTQKYRDDPIGDFAADVLRDKHFPLGVQTRQEAREYLSRRGVHTWFMRALRDAWAEFQAQRQV